MRSVLTAFTGCNELQVLQMLDTMTRQDTDAQGGTARMLAPLVCGMTLHWDGKCAASPTWEPLPGTESSTPIRSPIPPRTHAVVPTQRPMSRGHAALPTGVAGPLCLLPSAALHAIDWEAQAAGLTCTLDATLFPGSHTQQAAWPE